MQQTTVCLSMLALTASRREQKSILHHSLDFWTDRYLGLDCSSLHVQIFHTRSQQASALASRPSTFSHHRHLASTKHCRKRSRDLGDSNDADIAVDYLLRGLFYSLRLAFNSPPTGMPLWSCQACVRDVRRQCQPHQRSTGFCV